MKHMLRMLAVTLDPDRRLAGVGGDLDHRSRPHGVELHRPPHDDHQCHRRFEATAGTIDYTPGNPGATKADITIETKSVNTRNARRDADLKSDNFFNVEKFPTITFKSKRVQNVRADGFDMVGDLTIRDVTKEVVLKVEGIAAPIKDPQGNRRVGANATTTINRKDYGVNWNRAIEAGGVVVGDEVKINIEIEAVEKKS